jgi:RNA polymerase sigma factor (sigma-70 family)
VVGESLSDSVLIERSRVQPDAFKVLFERHFDGLFRYLAHRTSSAVAEDLAAETFTIAFAKRARYVAFGESARPWLFSIATNLLRERARKDRRGVRALGQLAGRIARSEEDDRAVSDAREDARGERERLWEALRGLRREEREALLLFAWADLSYAEIAVALACPIGTVRSRIARARLALTPSLSDLDPSDTDELTSIEVLPCDHA